MKKEQRRNDMTKEDWLQICRLSMEWYYVQTVFDGKPLSEDDKKWIDEHMPSDDIFDDGRIEYFQENFKQSIDEEKLDELAVNDLYPDDKFSFGVRTAEAKLNILIWKRGYRKANEL